MRIVSPVCFLTAMVLLLSAYIGPAAAESFLAKKEQAQATIVVGEQTAAFDRWVPGELQR
jgi:hypothetical protein